MALAVFVVWLLWSANVSLCFAVQEQHVSLTANFWSLDMALVQFAVHCGRQASSGKARSLLFCAPQAAKPTYFQLFSPPVMVVVDVGEGSCRR